MYQSFDTPFGVSSKPPPPADSERDENKERSKPFDSERDEPQQVTEGHEQQSYQFINLHNIPDKELAASPKTGFVEYCFKHVDDVDFIIDFKKFLEVAELPDKSWQMDGLITQYNYYLLDNANISDKDEFAELMAAYFGTRSKENIMSLLQQEFDAGIDVGMQRGVQETAKRAYAVGVDLPIIKLLTNYSDDDLQKLLTNDP